MRLLLIAWIVLSRTLSPTYAWFPPFRCRSSVAVSPFCRCKILLFCKNYVRKFRSVTAINSKKVRNGSGNGNGVRKWQRPTGTAKRQRKNGDGMMETGHYTTLRADQEPQQTRWLRTRSESIMISPTLTFSSQLPLKRLGHGTKWLLKHVHCHRINTHYSRFFL